MTEISHALYGGVIAQSIGKDEDDFSHAGFDLLKRIATKFTETMGKAHGHRELCGYKMNTLNGSTLAPLRANR